MSAAVSLFVTFVARPGHEAGVLDILRAMVAPSIAEPGNEMYQLLVGDGEPDGCVYHLIERYRDGEALDEHRRTDHYANYRASIREHLAVPIEVIRMRDPDTISS